jgi:hypothetical protein
MPWPAAANQSQGISQTSAWIALMLFAVYSARNNPFVQDSSRLYQKQPVSADNNAKQSRAPSMP